MTRVPPMPNPGRRLRAADLEPPPKPVVTFSARQGKPLFDGTLRYRSH
jgi:hypothetical protein